MFMFTEMSMYVCRSLYTTIFPTIVLVPIHLHVKIYIHVYPVGIYVLCINEYASVVVKLSNYTVLPFFSLSVCEHLINFLLMLFIAYRFSTLFPKKYTKTSRNRIFISFLILEVKRIRFHFTTTMLHVQHAM